MRLSLNRETLRDLNGQELTHAAGGTLTAGGYCTAYCSFSHRPGGWSRIGMP